MEFLESPITNDFYNNTIWYDAGSFSLCDLQHLQSTVLPSMICSIVTVMPITMVDYKYGNGNGFVTAYMLKSIQLIFVIGSKGGKKTQDNMYSMEEIHCRALVNLYTCS